MIDTRDDDLPCGEFQKLRETAVSMGRDQAAGHEADLDARTFSGARDRVIVTYCATPCFKNADSLESFSTDGERTAPREIPAMIAEHAERT